MLVGDGKYTGDTPGTYYMGTDAGYMRPTLFGGFFDISDVGNMDLVVEKYILP